MPAPVQSARPTARRAGAFSLVELLIVVVILGIFAVIVVPQFTEAAGDSREAALRTALTEVRTAIERYHAEHGVYPGSATAVPAAGCATGTKGQGTAANPGQRAKAFREQLFLYTDRNGAACSVRDATFRFGPYLRSTARAIPQNPVTESATLAVVTTGDLRLSSGAVPGKGWRYDTRSGAFIADDAAWDHL